MGKIQTLNGPVDSFQLGSVLPHEHLPLFAQPQDNESFPLSSWGLLKEWFDPLLNELDKTPFRTMVEVTPIALGRDIPLWKEIVGRKRLNVVLSTGFYIDERQPEWAKEKPADDIAEFMVRELKEGIGESGVRAGIIKIAPDASSGQSRKVCRAAAMASRKTNARITTHSWKTNRQDFDLLVEFGADPGNIFIGHADFAGLEENDYICRHGGNVIFTMWGLPHILPDKVIYEQFARLVKSGHVNRTLISIDFAVLLDSPSNPYYFKWSYGGTDRRTFSYIPRVVIPKLSDEYGISPGEIRIMTEDNCRLMLDYET
ncbi:MAG TPA: hypothetical protein PKN36_07800 [bacterium]|nr:hypothetical protein [bacterium]